MATGATVRPQVVLHIGPSDEGRLAFELLERANVDFRAIASRRSVPLATFGRLRFAGLEEMQHLVDTLRQIEAVWLLEATGAAPKSADGVRPALMAEDDAWRAHWREQARAVLTRLHANVVPAGFAPGPPQPPRRRTVGH